jgi:DNA repair exonuclease SbcCD ATPase subunit
MISNLTNQVSDLKTSLNIHKDIVHSLLAGNSETHQNQCIETIFNEMIRNKENLDDIDEEKNALEAKCLILEQINDEIKFKEQETELMLQERISDLNEAIERKEFLFQLKEQKWAAIEYVMVDYAREDLKLQRMLADLRYIWDDVSKRRNVRNVLQENEDLKEELENQKKTISILSQRVQDCLIASNSNEIAGNLTQTSSAKKSSNESRKLPDLNCFNVQIVNNDIIFIPKSEAQRFNEQIKHLENVIDEQCVEIRDLKSSIYDLSDTNQKIVKKMKDLKKKNLKAKKQTVDIKSKLVNITKQKKEPKIRQISQIIEDINEDCYSDEENRSVSCLTLSDAGSIYYPSKKVNSPMKKLSSKERAKLNIGYHRKTRSKIMDTSMSVKDNIKFDVGDVFLPTETMGVNQLSDLKSAHRDYNKFHLKKTDVSVWLIFDVIIFRIFINKMGYTIQKMISDN